MTTFQDLGLSEPLLRAIAADGYETPTPIQAQAIPHVLAGRDLFGCAQTGTGKTAAFAVPLIERLIADPKQVAPKQCRVLVLAPTRELAGQIHESFRSYGRNTKLRSTVIYGGVNQRPQATAMMRGLDVLIATPGRLIDLVNQRLVELKNVEYLVLDEADRMLDMGFIHDVRRIVKMIPTQRQTLFFSATLPKEVRSLADSMLRDPLEIQTTPQATPAQTVEQSVFFVPQKQKRHLLVHLLQDGAMSRVIVFTRTKHGADKLQKDLVKSGIRAEAIHGNKSQNQRERALAAFKSQKPPILIATDIAARGIDVDGVSHVVNYELPHEPETYVHRIGRTGRAGLTGSAVAFCDPEERSRLRDIERLLRKTIPARGELPQFDPALVAAVHDTSPERGDRGERSQGQGRSRSVIGGEARSGGRSGSGRSNSGGGRGGRTNTRSSGGRPSGGSSQGGHGGHGRAHGSSGGGASRPANGGGNGTAPAVHAPAKPAGPAAEGRPPQKKHRRAL
ncbi:MAG: DEAD/DEAH box helicase [Planctomycetia bacterium]|nr:DEAD/DEAH box helicase [Planctomycetia bacterium]